MGIVSRWLILVPLAGFAAGGSLTAAKNSATPGKPSIKTVWVIVMENQDWSSIKGSKFAPYINGTL